MGLVRLFGTLTLVQLRSAVLDVDDGGDQLGVDRPGRGVGVGARFVGEQLPDVPHDELVLEREIAPGAVGNGADAFVELDEVGFVRPVLAYSLEDPGELQPVLLARYALPARLDTKEP